MPSVSSPVKVALESYVAGRLKAERLVIAVSAEYYREARDGRREALQPLIDVIDRASPGIVELGTATGGPGFDIRLAVVRVLREALHDHALEPSGELGALPPE